MTAWKDYKRDDRPQRGCWAPGARKVVRIGGAYQPIDHDWLQGGRIIDYTR